MAQSKGGAELETVNLFSPGYRRYVIFLLFVVFAINFVDRQVIVILAEPIKSEFHLKDAQLGVITGLSFALLYSVLSIPVARLADRGDRSKVISISLAIWSLFTVLCGLAQTYWQLAAARLMVGVGEAGGSPPAHSLITDITPRKNWARAIAFYSLGIPVGSLIGMVMGGIVTDNYGWRTAFYIAGVPGLLLAVVAGLTLKEPRKILKRKAPDAPPLKEALRVMLAKRSFICLNLAGGCVTFINYSQSAFFPSFFKRSHGVELARLATSANALLHTHLGPLGFLGLFLGLTGAFAGITGITAGGYLTDWAAKREVGAFVWLAMIAAFIRIPLLIAAMLIPDAGLALAVLTVQLFFSGLMSAPSYTGIQALVEPRMRATASAILHFMLNAVGLGLGPLLVGLLSDRLAAGMGTAEGLRWAIIDSEVIMGVAVLLFAIATPFFRREAYVQSMSDQGDVVERGELEAAA